MRIVVLLFVLAIYGGAALCADGIITADGLSVKLEEPPSWVDRTAEPISVDTPADDALSLELSDHQILVEEGRTVRYQRVAARVQSRVGADAMAQIPLYFVPDFHRLSIHGAWVTRGTHRRSALNASQIRLVWTEPDMHRRVYRGMAAAVLFLKDVRVGDLVEFEYSIAGHNPIMVAPEFVLPLAMDGPTGRLRARLRARSALNYSMVVVDSSLTDISRTDGPYTVTTVEGRKLAAYQRQPNMPADEFHLPRAVIVPTRSWQDVEHWARGLFPSKSKLPAVLVDRVKEWKAKHPDKAGRAIAAVDYVQKELPYVSIALNESAVKPAEPSQVIERGFGDCKDKSLLLVTLLNAMDIVASPALVSAATGIAAFETRPNAIGFDHVIVRVELDGSIYWIDPTNGFQAGPLSARTVTGFGKALVVGAAANPVADLRTSGPTREVGVERKYRYTVHAFNKPVDFEARIRAHGAAADGMRLRWVTDRSGWEKEGLARYRALHPSMEIADAGSANTDEVTGDFEIVVRYRIPDFFAYERGKLSARVAPLGLYAVVNGDDQGVVRRSFRDSAELEVVFPEDVPLTSADPILVDDGFIRFDTKRSYAQKRLSASYTVTRAERRVPSSAYEAHRQVRKRIAELMPIALVIPTAAATGIASNANRKSAAESMIADEIDTERAYTRDIESGRLTDTQTSQAYLWRSWARDRQGNYAAGLTDARQALAIDPKNVSAVETIAGQLAMLQRFEEARQQYEAAAKTLGDDAQLSYGSGRLAYYEQRYADARADFRRAASLERDVHQNLYHLIWLFMSAQRAGGDGKSELQSFVGSDRTSWPGPVLDLFLDGRDVESVYRAARTGNDTTQLGQLCEAYFFVGQYLLLNRDVDGAREAFEHARATGVVGFMEHVYAGWELQRLEKASSGGAARASQ